MTSDSEQAVPPPAEPAPASDGTIATKPVKVPKKETWGSFLKFLVILFFATVVLRSCIVAPFSIPSGSMLPNLLIGDYLFVSKWSYGYSRYSFPFGIARFDGRIMGSVPDPGDVVVFRHPFSGDDWVKRVIGRPGDTIAVRDGQVILNGQPVARQRVEDFVLPLTENMVANGGCHFNGNDAVQRKDGNGQDLCVYPRYRETLPNGRSYEVLDQGNDPARRTISDRTGSGRDNVDPFVVPAGVVFVMGDNRDDSLDSRFPASIVDERNGVVAEHDFGVGLLPIENIEGRALVSFFSTDGGARWLLPWTWFTAARWSRIGMTYP